MEPRAAGRSSASAGRRWSAQRERLTVRAPRPVELGVRRLTLTTGDLSRAFCFACDQVDPESPAYVNTMSNRREDVARRPKRGRAFLVKVGAPLRARLIAIAQENQVPVNCVVVEILSAFLQLIERQRGIKKELTDELRRRRGF